MLRKKRSEKTRFAQTVFRSDRFFLPLLGANQRQSVWRIFDRFAMTALRLGLTYRCWVLRIDTVVLPSPLNSASQSRRYERLGSARSRDTGNNCFHPWNHLVSGSRQLLELLPKVNVAIIRRNLDRIYSPC